MEHREVVARVTDEDRRESAGRTGMRGRGADMLHLGRVEAAEREEIAAADEKQLVEEGREGDRMSPGRRRVGILVEGRQGRPIAAADAERAVAEDALGVDQVVEEFADAPLSCFVAPGLPIGGDRAHDRTEDVELLLEREQRVRFGREGEIGLVVGAVLGRRWAGVHEILRGGFGSLRGEAERSLPGRRVRCNAWGTKPAPVGPNPRGAAFVD